MILKIQAHWLTRARVGMVRATSSLADKAKILGDFACVVKPNVLRIIADMVNELSAAVQK
jgi:hypothetical protein